MTILLPNESPDHVVVEQRRGGRYAFRLPVTMLRGREEIPLRTEDVSYEGLFLETDEPPPLRHLIRLRLLIPPFHRELDAFAMAVHAPRGGRLHGVGVQLYALDRAARTVWGNFVTRVRLGDFERDRFEPEQLQDQTCEIRFLPPEIIEAQSRPSGMTWPSQPAGAATPSR